VSYFGGFLLNAFAVNPSKLFEPKLVGFGTKMTGKTDPCGLYYKRITIINDHSGIISR
jgi:hypothetical protein